MDINLPLILLIAVTVTGVVWLLDIFVISKPRKAVIRSVNAKYAHLTEEEKASSEVYQGALADAPKEPLIVEYSKSFFPLLAIVFALRSFLIEPFQIPSESMVPTLQVGDFIAVNKYAYGIRLPVIQTKIIEIGQPQRGDVVVFFPPHENRYFIKRLIGLPGDTVRYSNNVLYINGEEIEQELIGYDDEEPSGACWASFALYQEKFGEETHTARKCVEPTPLGREGSWKVPDGHYFMMGDNRDNSLDSRAWDDPFVPDKNIVGKAFAIWMHWNGGLPGFARAGKIE